MLSMVDRVHQAYYGELRGGHDLLATSATGAEYVQNLKWLTDRPSAGTVAWSPYLSGLPWGEFYVLMRTFPAAARPGSRGGFVFTHALFFPVHVAAQAGDLGALLALLVDAVPVLGDIFSLPALQPPPPRPAPQFRPGPRARAAARALLSRPVGGRPVVWLGQEGFDAFVTRLWAGLWPEARASLSFRVSFDPADAERGHPMFVATPVVARTRWTGFSVVDLAEPGEPPTEAELLLAGEASALHPRILEFGVDSADLAAARQIETAADLLERVDALTPDDSRLLVRVLAAINDDPRIGASAKTRALERLAGHVSTGGVAYIATLRSLPAQPFQDRLARVANAVAGWITLNFLADPRTLTKWITNDTGEGWWSAAVRKGLKTAFKQWRPGTVEAIWSGILASPQAVTDVLELVADSAGAGTPWSDLAASCPEKLPSEIAKAFADYGRAHRSVALFAAATDSGRGISVAVDELLKPEWSDTATRGWSVLVERHGPAEIVPLTVERTSEALFAFTAPLVAAEPSLREPLDPKLAGWRTLWLHSITAGAQPWEGIPRPERVRDTLIDAALDGDPVESALLRYVAQTKWGDLGSYPRQAEVWANPAFPAREELLGQTAAGWIDAFAAAPDDTSLPHDVVLEKVRSLAHTFYASGGAFAGNLRTVIVAFERITVLDERHLLEWVTSHRSRLVLLTTEEGLRLGRLVARKRWGRAARKLFAERRSSAAVWTALAECSSLLGILDQLRLQFESPDSGRFDSTAWYAALLQFVVEHYQHGPEDDRIWQRAGGNLADLSGRSPRESWSSAVRLLQAGRGPEISTSRLLQEMRDDFRYNPDLKLLDDAYRKHL